MLTTRSSFFRRMETARPGEPVASYGGIALKCIWFWLLCFGGAAAFSWLPLGSATSSVLLGGAALSFLCPLVIRLFPALAVPLGSFGSFALGFLLRLICSQYAKAYAGIVYLAAGITVLVFFIVLLLYRSKAIQVNQKFRGVVTALFLASILGSALVFVSSFFTTALTGLLWGSGPIAIVVAATALLIAVINLVFEFDGAAQVVQQGLGKKYEWAAAFGLFISVVTVFLRVLELAAKLADKNGGQS